jgi:hypothetical protein
VFQNESTLGGGGSTIGGSKDLRGLIPFKVKDAEGGLEVPSQAAVNGAGGIHGEKSKGDGRTSSVGAATAFLGAGALWTEGAVRRGGVGSDTRVLFAGGRGTGVSGETAGAGVRVAGVS